MNISSPRTRSYVVLSACIVVLILADVGPFSRVDAAIAAIAMSVIIPFLAPYLLLLLSTLQDSAGMSGYWWYIGFVLVGSIVIVTGWVHFINKLRYNGFLVLIIIAITTVCYAIIASLIQSYMGGHPQADTRHPLLVGGLMVFMIIVGMVACSCFDNEKRSTATHVILLIIFHSIGISIAQMFDITLFHSAAGIVEINETAQLSVANALGIPRISGTYLTPNGWAYCNILLLILGLQLHYGVNSISKRDALIFFVVAVFFSTVAFSKALLIFSFLTSIIMYWQAIKGVKIIYLCFAGMLLIVSIYFIDFDVLGAAFRIDSASQHSYRYQMWNAILSVFDLHDWVFGVGLGYWPIFFQDHLNMTGSDPHTVLLSAPGTFGLLGVVLYVVLLLFLLHCYLNNTGFNKILAMILFVLFFVKDMVSYPYFLGNTPLTALIWGLLLLLGVNIMQQFFMSDSSTLSSRAIKPGTF